MGRFPVSRRCRRRFYEAAKTIYEAVKMIYGTTKRTTKMIYEAVKINWKNILKRYIICMELRRLLPDVRCGISGK